VPRDGGHEVTFDPTINIVSLLTLLIGGVVWLITIVIAWTKIDRRIDKIDFRVDLVEKTLEKISNTLDLMTKNNTQIALMAQELTALHLSHTTLNKTVEDLRRGTGWITSSRDSITGEYSRTV
jgi:predicted PurR-regulated permease PerM